MRGLAPDDDKLEEVAAGRLDIMEEGNHQAGKILRIRETMLDTRRCI